MKSLAVLFLLATVGVFLTGCATEYDPNAGTDYADPDPLRTQSRIQEMHSDALRQDF